MHELLHRRPVHVFEIGAADRLRLIHRTGTQRDIERDDIFHLAAVVSGEAEADFEKGYRVNLDGTRYLFEAIRKENYQPRVVFTSSIAVFGAPFPSEIPDEFHLTPLTSYGTQKAIGELLLSDYSRRGLLDGIGIRLPTICVRPGKPNKAASGFFSGIIREPLNGMEAILPVPTDVRHWFASPRAAVNFMIHAAQIDSAKVAATAAIHPRMTRGEKMVVALIGDRLRRGRCQTQGSCDGRHRSPFYQPDDRRNRRVRPIE